MKGAYSVPQGDKVVAEGCSEAGGGGWGGSLVFRGSLVQLAAPLFRFPSQRQAAGIDVSSWNKAERRSQTREQRRVLTEKRTTQPGVIRYHKLQCWNTSFILRSPPLAFGCPLYEQACGGVKQPYGTRPLLLTSVFAHETRVVQDHHPHRHAGYWSRQ